MSQRSGQGKKDLKQQHSDNLVEGLRRSLSAKSIVGYMLLGAIAVVFVFFGFRNDRFGGHSGSIAVVNGQLITLQEFQQEEQRLLEQYAQYFKGQDMEPFRKMFRDQVYSELVQLELVAQVLEKNHVYVTDEEVRDTLVKEIPAFQENGRFKRERYTQYLSWTKMTAGAFERKLQKSMHNLRVRKLFEGSFFPTQSELERDQALADSKIQLEFLRVKSPDVKPKTNEKAEDFIAKVNTLLSAKDVQGLNRLAHGQKWDWKKVEGNLKTLQFGELPENVVSESLNQLKDAGAMSPQVISSGPEHFVVRLVNKKIARLGLRPNETKPNEAKPKENKSVDTANREISAMQRENGAEAFSAWLDQYRQKAQIRKNEEFFRASL